MIHETLSAAGSANYRRAHVDGIAPSETAKQGEWEIRKTAARALRTRRVSADGRAGCRLKGGEFLKYGLRAAD